MLRRIFAIFSAASLILFISAVLPLMGAPGGRLLLRDGGGSIARGSRVASYALVYDRNEIAIDWTYSDMWSSGVGGPTWALALLFAALPVAWLVVAATRGSATAGSCTNCTQCGYNLTGNTSGICPECGVAVVRSAPANPPRA